MKRVLVVYQFATLGGVERALINRAIALKESGSNIQMDLFFLRDYGGLSPLQTAISHLNLHKQIRIVDRPSVRNYEFISVIDTPEFFQFIPNNNRVLVECHSSGYEAQRYLSDLPPKVSAVAVPSHAMQKRLGSTLDVPVKVLPNRLPRFGDDDRVATVNQPILFYLGRIEPGKNVTEALYLHAATREFIPDIRMLIVTPTADWSHVYQVSKKLKTQDTVLIHGAIPFHKLQHFYSRLDRARSFFVSSSRHETWGLSAAEAFVAGIPAVLSDNEGHREVARGDSSFLYRRGFPDEGADLIKQMMADPTNIKNRVMRLREFHTRLGDVVEAFEGLL